MVGHGAFLQLGAGVPAASAGGGVHQFHGDVARRGHFAGDKQAIPALAAAIAAFIRAGIRPQPQKLAAGSVVFHVGREGVFSRGVYVHALTMAAFRRAGFGQLQGGHVQAAGVGVLGRRVAAVGQIRGPIGGKVHVDQLVHHRPLQPGSAGEQIGRRGRVFITGGTGIAQFVIGAGHVAGVIELIGHGFARVGGGSFHRGHPGGQVLVIVQPLRAAQGSVAGFHGQHPAYLGGVIVNGRRVVGIAPLVGQIDSVAVKVRRRRKQVGIRFISIGRAAENV